MIYIFDTNVLSAYAEPPHDDVTTSNHQRAVWTVDRLRKAKATLFIPTPVLMEYLIIKEPETHASHTALLNKVFQYAELDVPAAEMAASLLRRFHQERAQRRKAKERRVDDADKYNSVHGIDAQVVAIAKMRKSCNGVFSLDGDVDELASYVRVPVLKLDTTAEDLFPSAPTRR